MIRLIYLLYFVQDVWEKISYNAQQLSSPLTCEKFLFLYFTYIPTV